MGRIFITGTTGDQSSRMATVLAWHHRCDRIVYDWVIGDPVPEGNALVLTTDPLDRIVREIPDAHVRTMALAMERIELHRQPDPDSPSFEHWSCATGHLMAERTLRLLADSRSPSVEMLEGISNLVERAGPAFAREYLCDEVPF